MQARILKLRPFSQLGEGQGGCTTYSADWADLGFRLEKDVCCQFLRPVKSDSVFERNYIQKLTSFSS